MLELGNYPSEDLSLALVSAGRISFQDFEDYQTELFGEWKSNLKFLRLALQMSSKEISLVMIGCQRIDQFGNHLVSVIYFYCC